MEVKVIALPAQQGIKFDLILPYNYVVTITMDEYEVRHYRSGSIADVIEQKVLDFLRQNDYPVDTVSIIYC